MKMPIRWILPVIILALAFCLWQGIALAYGFLIGIAYGFFALKKDGKSLKQVGRSFLKEILSYHHVYLIVLLLGMNIAGWMSSGVLAQMMVLGLSVLNPHNFLAVALFFSALVSVAMGTGLGTLSTVGLVFWGIGKSLGFPSEVVLGMLISGAYVADVASPMSLLLNLNLKANDIGYRAYMRKFLPLLSGGLILSYIAYLFLFQGPMGADAQGTDAISKMIHESFHIHPLMLLLPGISILLALGGISLSFNFLFSIITGSFLSIFYQGNSLGTQLHYLIFGYQNHHMNELLQALFRGGGLLNTAHIVIIIALALGFSYLLKESGALKRLKHIFVKGKTPLGLCFGTGLFSIFMTSVGCDQSLGILNPSAELKEDYQKAGYDKESLATHISASGVIIAPVQPWNVNALIIYGFTGVSATVYGPYTFLCFLMPLWLLGYVAIKEIIRKRRDGI